MDLNQLSQKDLEGLALQQLALKCKTDLFYLCRYILGYEKMTENTHRELCTYATSVLQNHEDIDLEKYPALDPRKNLLLLLMPRGTFKSSVVTIGFTLQFLLNEPNGRVLIDSETFTKAKNFLAEIKGHLEDNEKFRMIFRAIHGVFPDDNKKNSSTRWTDSQVDLACRTQKKKEPSISCSGVDKSINGMHYDLIIADDLHSEKNVTNDEQLQGVRDHYKLCFSLLDPGKPLIVIGTRWHMLDLYQHILDFQGDDFNVLRRSAYNDDGSLFFPEVLSEAELDKIRRIQGSSIFSKQYLNKPVSDETAVFKMEDIGFKHWEEVRGMPINWYLVIDPSYSDPRGTSTYSDFAAFVIAGMDFQRNLYVRYIKRAKMTYAQVIEEIFRIYTSKEFEELKIGKVLLEVIGTKSLSFELANEQRRKNTWLPITEIKFQAKSKEERIRGLAPFYENKNVYHIRECPEIEMLADELVNFPAGRHDDVIDAFAMVLQIASPPNNKAARVYADEKERAAAYKPRSAVTGY